jgi:DHA2 family multidrug resistance protein
MYACLYASNVLLPEMMQNLMGYSPTMAGLTLSPAGLFTMAVVPIVGYLLTRGVDARLFGVCGLLAAGGATMWISRLDLGVSPAHILWPRVVQSIGSGMTFVSLSTIAFRYLPREESGNASALYALVRNEGSSLGVALVTTMLARGAQRHQALIAGRISMYSPAAVLMMRRMAAKAGGSDLGNARSFAVQMAYRLVGQQAGVLSYLDQFRHFGGLVLLIVPLVFLLKRTPLERGLQAGAPH